MKEIVELLKKVGLILQIIPRLDTSASTLSIWTVLRQTDPDITKKDVQELLNTMQEAGMIVNDRAYGQTFWDVKLGSGKKK